MNPKIKILKYKPILIVALVFFTLGISSQNTKPNIVLIIADDLGWSQVSTGKTNFGNSSDFYETPVIARLANEGISFPNAYTNGANCAPTRAAILSGQYPMRPTNNVFGVDNLNRKGGANTSLCGPMQGIPNGQDELPAESITVAETLKTAGYSTAHIGKFHVGGSMNSNKPESQGFDFNYGGGSPGNPANYFATQFNENWEFSENIGVELDQFAAPYTSNESYLLAGTNELTGTPKHVTDALADAAIQFMNNKKDTPFFIHFSQYAVHGPYGKKHARPDLLKKYEQKEINNPSKMGHNAIGQGAILEGMDQTIGRIVHYLETTPDPRNSGHMLVDNTLIYFLSDNGGTVSTNDNGPLKGVKGEYNEGGIRSVSLAWSPGLVANPGSIIETPFLSLDLYPTFVELAQGSLPSNYQIDGISILPILNGTNTSMNRGSLFWHFPGYLIKPSHVFQKPESIIRKGDYKLRYTYENKTYRLYNIKDDIGELNDLLVNNPIKENLLKAKELSKELKDFLTETNAPMPLEQDSNGKCTQTEVSLPEVFTHETLSTKPLDLKIKYGFNVYPNPFKDYFNLQFKNELTFKSIYIKLQDIEGRDVFLPKKITFKDNYISLDPIKSGIYILSVESENNKTSKKLIKTQ